MSLDFDQRRSRLHRLVSILSGLPRSPGFRHTAILGAAMIAAGGLDYAANVLVGRWLQPVQYGVFVSVTALIQVLLLLSITIRIVVGFSTAEVRACGGSTEQVASFIQGAWRWAWRWGLLAIALMAVMSPLIRHLLRLPENWQVWAATLMVAMLFLRETTYGALQGIQEFGGLGLVQVSQALLRIIFAAALIGLGLKATGAILAQPLSCAVGLLPAMYWLRPYFRHRAGASERVVNWRYSAQTFFGLTIFGLLTNSDALFVRHFFTPQVAGYYGPVVTLAKISLFLPWAISIILIPKVTQRRAAGLDPRPVLVLSLVGAVVPGLLITAVYFVAPGTLVKTIFSSAYPNPGIVLSLASLASSLYAGLNIWLNYALSLERPAFIYAAAAVLVYQVVAMMCFGRENLIFMTVAMVSAGLLGNLAGFMTTRYPVPLPQTTRASVTA